jgi:hypothetical protein
MVPRGSDFGTDTVQKILRGENCTTDPIKTRQMPDKDH